MENVLHTASAKKKGFNQTGFLTVKPIGLGNLIFFDARCEDVESFWWFMDTRRVCGDL